MRYLMIILDALPRYVYFLHGFQKPWADAASQCCQMNMRLVSFDDYEKFKCVAEFIACKPLGNK
jgi:hypothetical protein